MQSPVRFNAETYTTPDFRGIIQLPAFHLTDEMVRFLKDEESARIALQIVRDWRDNRDQIQVWGLYLVCDEHGTLLTDWSGIDLPQWWIQYDAKASDPDYLRAVDGDWLPLYTAGKLDEETDLFLYENSIPTQIAINQLPTREIWIESLMAMGEFDVIEDPPGIPVGVFLLRNPEELGLFFDDVDWSLVKSEIDPGIPQSLMPEGSTELQFVVCALLGEGPMSAGDIMDYIVGTNNAIREAKAKVTELAKTTGRDSPDFPNILEGVTKKKITSALNFLVERGLAIKDDGGKWSRVEPEAEPEGAADDHDAPGDEMETADEGKPWPPAKVEQLVLLRSTKGWSHERIARKMGKTKASVASKCGREGIIKKGAKRVPLT